MIKKILLTFLFLLFAAWLITWLSLRFERHEYAPITEAQKQAAEDYLRGKLTPVPDGWQWQTFSVNPGVELRAGTLEAGNSKGTVVIIPGFSGSIEMVMRETRRFHNAGFSVATIEYRGQGLSYRPLSNPEKGYVEDYAVLAHEIAEFAKSVADPNKPLFFYSISMGAHITMRMAMQEPIDVTAYALMVPMIQVGSGGFDYDRLRLVANLLTRLGLGRMYSPGQSGYTPETYGEATPCNANPDTAQSQGAMFALNKKLRTRGVTVKWLNESIKSTDQLFSKQAIDTITQPIKMFNAGIDHLVNAQAAGRFCRSLANCQETLVKEARHCITRENFELYDQLVDDAIAHFNQHSG